MSYIFSTRKAFQMVVETKNFERTVQIALGQPSESELELYFKVLKAYVDNTEYMGILVEEINPMELSCDLRYNIMFQSDDKNVSFTTEICKKTGKLSESLKVYLSHHISRGPKGGVSK